MRLEHITIDPEICRGQATVRGTRITAEFVLKLMGNGYDAREIARQYPEISTVDVFQCAAYGAWLASERSYFYGPLEQVATSQ